MTRVLIDSKPPLSPQFCTLDSNAEVAFLDVGRAEVMFNSMDLANLEAQGSLPDFVRASYAASSGDVAVLELLIQTFDNWRDVDKAFEAEIRESWSSPSSLSHTDAIVSLRSFCCRYFPFATMVDAIFNNPTFDFVAHLKWRNSDD